MRKFIKKAACVALCAVIGLSAMPAVGCSSGNNVEFWSSYSTVKIKQDRHDYDETNEKLEAKIDLTMAQGEYETAQIIFTPKKDVKEYTVTVSDLTNVDTGEVFSKDRIKVYKQEYMYIASIRDNLDGKTTPGYYPDAMIPLEAVINYKENKVSAGDNQGISFRFSTRPELDENGIAVVKNENATKDSERFNYVSSGTYKGSVEFNIDGVKTKIPVTLNIADATVSETNHVKSYYAVWRSAQVADLNCTQEGLDIWTDLFKEYRLSNRLIYNDLSVDPKILEDVTDQLCEVLKDPRYSCFTIEGCDVTYGSNFGTEEDVENRKVCFTKESFLQKFKSEYYPLSFYHPEYAEDYLSKFVKTDEDGNEYAYIDSLTDEYAGDMVFMQEQVWYVLRNSLRDGINYLDKCQYEFAKIDEPWSHNGHNGVTACLTLFRAAIIDLAERISVEGNPSLNIEGKIVTLDFDNSTLTKEEIINSVLNFKTIVTADYLETYEGIVEKWCPTNDFYASEEARENNYGKQTEKWWYPVSDPLSISIVTEVSPLYQIIQGWMMSEYDVSGTLYWGGGIFYDFSEGNVQIDEYFRSNYYRYSTVNGEGNLAYPGAQYELDEGIPSLRLEALRDGLEDYELLYNLKNTYSEVSEKIGVEFDASSVITSLCSSLFANDKISATTQTYMAARQSLLNLTSSAESAANMCIVDYTDDGYGSVDFKVYVNDGVKLYNAGKEVTTVYKDCEGGTIYTISQKLDGSVNMLDLSFTVNGKEYGYSQNLGGNVNVYNVGSFKTSDFVESSDLDLVSTEVDCTTENIYTELGGKAIKLVVGESKEKKDDYKLQYFKFESDFIKNNLSNASKVIFHIYNASEEDINFKIEYKQNGVDNFYELTTTTLVKGENTLTITLPSINWETEWIEYFDFCVGEKETAKTIKTLYFKDIIVYE